MKKQLNNNSHHIITFCMVGLLAFLLIGCQQINEVVNTNANRNNSNSKLVENTNTPSENTHISVENSNTLVENLNTSVENSNTSVENSNTSTEQAKSASTPKPPEVKAFENSLIGTWSDANEKVIFAKDEIKFYGKGTDQLDLTWKYNVVDEKTVEITDENGNKSSATMSIEDNNTKLAWKDKVGSFVYTRESSKP